MCRGRAWLVVRGTPGFKSEEPTEGEQHKRELQVERAAWRATCRKFRRRPCSCKRENRTDDHVGVGMRALYRSGAGHYHCDNGAKGAGARGWNSCR